MYYANNQDESKGNSHYNVGGDVKDSGVDIKTGNISGKIEGNHTVESLRDTFDSRNRGYSISTGSKQYKGKQRYNIQYKHTECFSRLQSRENCTENNKGSL